MTPSTTKNRMALGWQICLLFLVASILIAAPDMVVFAIGRNL